MGVLSLGGDICVNSFIGFDTLTKWVLITSAINHFGISFVNLMYEAIQYNKITSVESKGAISVLRYILVVKAEFKPWVDPVMMYSLIPNYPFHWPKALPIERLTYFWAVRLCSTRAYGMIILRVSRGVDPYDLDLQFFPPGLLNKFSINSSQIWIQSSHHYGKAINLFRMTLQWWENGLMNHSKDVGVQV